MPNLFHALLNTGVDATPDVYQKRITRFVNLFALFVMCGLLIGATNVLFLGKEYPWAFEGILFMCAILILVLNKTGYYQSATYLFLVSVSLSIFYVNEYYDISSAAYLYYFPMILCIALLHNPQKGIGQTVAYFAINTCFICTSLFFDFEWLRNKQITAAENHIIFCYNITMSVVLSAALVVFVIQIIDRQNVRLLRALQKEKIIQENISQSLREKEVMLAEVHHRVKNNLAVISSLLNLQMGSTQNEEARKLLNDARNRVGSMALVHEKLYVKKQFSNVAFDTYISELSHDLLSGFTKFPIELSLETSPVEIGISRAIPLGLIANEIITNSIKHAFPYHTHPCITIKLQHHQNMLLLMIGDNGKGFDRRVELEKNHSLGLTLIDSLVEQLDGKLEFSHTGGTHYKVSIQV